MLYRTDTAEPLGSTTTLHDAVRALARNWSIEVTPRETEKLGDGIAAYIPAGTRVYVTWLIGSDFSNTVAAVKRLRAAGLEPVPHLAARAIPDASALEDILSRLREAAAVKQALLIGGAGARPVGQFDSSIQVLDTDLFQRYGITQLGVAAHPEGSPDIPEPALSEALRAKNDYASRSALALELTTQFCFDPVPVVDWERRVRQDGNRLPMTIGLAGLAGLTTLIKHARNCGVGNSLGVLMKQSTKILRLASAVEPSDVILGLAKACQADTSCAFRRLHYFPFGALEATARYATALAAGSFEIDRNGERLRIAG